MKNKLPAMEAVDFEGSYQLIKYTPNAPIAEENTLTCGEQGRMLNMMLLQKEKEKHMRQIKKTVSVLLIAVMMLAMLPVTALADEAKEKAEESVLTEVMPSVQEDAETVTLSESSTRTISLPEDTYEYLTIEVIKADADSTVILSSDSENKMADIGVGDEFYILFKHKEGYSASWPGNLQFNYYWPEGDTAAEDETVISSLPDPGIETGSQIKTDTLTMPDANLYISVTEMNNQKFLSPYCYADEYAFTGNWKLTTESVDCTAEVPYTEAAKTVGKRMKYSCESEVIAQDGYLLDKISYTTAEGATVDVPVENVLYTKFEMPHDATVSVETVPLSSVPMVTEIYTEEDLFAFAYSVNAGYDYSGITVTLENDIELTKKWTPAGCEYSAGTEYNGQKVTSKQHFFRGTFEGNGHTIKNMMVDNSCQFLVTSRAGGNAGFFYEIYGATIKDLNVAGKIEVTNCMASGGIAGASGGSPVVISGCSSSVYVDHQVTPLTNTPFVGGIIGCVSNGGTISDCSNSGTVISGSSVSKYGALGGGIVGRSDSNNRCTNIERCSNTGSINGNGGILGYGFYVKITECVNKGNVSGCGMLVGSGIGGIVGSIKDSRSEIISCYNTGDLCAYSGEANRRSENEPTVCGILGAPYRKLSTDGTYYTIQNIIKNCYSIGNLKKTGKYTSLETLCGDIIPSKDMTAVKLSGGTEITTVVDVVAPYVEDCYGRSDDITAELMNTNYPDTWAEQNGTVRLRWETEIIDDNLYPVTFDVTPDDSTVTVFRDAEMTEVIEPGAEGYSLTNGTYYYSAEHEGYLTRNGSFTVDGMPTSVTVTLTKGAVMTFTAASENGQELADAQLGITPADPSEADRKAELVSKDGSTSIYMLYPDTEYIVNCTCEGYNSAAKEITGKDGDVISFALTGSSRPDTENEYFIYGDRNTGKDHTITKGGTYYIGDGAEGVLTVDTTDPVTLVGKGTATTDKFTDLYIDCVQESSDLTLDSIYISETEGDANVVDFTGEGNRLSVSGVCLIDMDTGAAGYATIHVPEDGELTMSSEDGGVLYMYKSEQGAGIGGNGGASGDEGLQPETNGKINLVNLTLYAKGTKQGAVIGAGAEAGTKEPGDINITGCNLNIITMARGAAIGGSAGSSGASKGAKVTVTDSQISTNIDYSGAAIGGGGYGGGNDAEGGTLVVNGSSIRAWMNQNACGQWSRGKYGINGNSSITADIVDSDGNPLYLCVIGMSDITDDSCYITCDGEKAYEGTLHRYNYINSAVLKENEKEVYYTPANWVTSADNNLYLYFTGENHVIKINGKSYVAKWDDESESFTLKEGYDGLYGDVNFNGAINIVDAQIAYDMANGMYTEEEKYETMKLAADVNEDGEVNALDARAIQVCIHTGSFSKK